MNNKKVVWVPDKKELFAKAVVEKEELTAVTVDGGRVFSASDVHSVNPPKFDKTADLAQLSYLNEPSVLDTLKNRYEMDEIYTMSGIFLISMNPYKSLGLYTEQIRNGIEGKRYKSPHVYKTAQSAYDLMVETGRNQSILITGESGAGKTENTKRVIEYLGRSGSSGINSLLTTANPLLEAFGNAKTMKNENSSRFGKFIQVFFQNKTICGCRIEKYLLELSRICLVGINERNYHIFYFILHAPDALKKELHLEGKTFRDFNLLRGGNEKAVGIDDKKEFENLQKSFRVFSMNSMEYYRVIAGIMHLSNIEFEGGEKAEIKNKDVLEIACSLLEISKEALATALTNPSVQAGREAVRVTRSAAQAKQILQAVMKTLYGKLFDTLIEQVNSSFSATQYENFIGVLDIAGFEIFKSNSFEQLMVNYTNEKLQQFFNHNMFVEEQKVYDNEGIPWEFIDFGLDLEPCIKTIESSNPIGILSYLDEECVMPGATDRSIIGKILSIKTADGKNSVIKPVKTNPQNFILKHYAGDVEYTTVDWIKKNQNVSSKEIDNLIGSFSFSKKKGIFRTVSQDHRENLKNLMAMLTATMPHFVRCILPNLQKRPGTLEKQLILYQLRCNGVLEGLRISRLGYPTRLTFKEIASRYWFFIRSQEKKDNYQNTAMKILEELVKTSRINQADFKVGQTTVFFKQGVVADLESNREKYLVEMAVIVQGILRHKLNIRKQRYAEVIQQSHTAIASDAIKSISFINSPWWRLFMKVKPLLEVRKSEIESDRVNVKISKLKEELTVLTDTIKYRDEDITSLKEALVKASKQHSEALKESDSRVAEAEELCAGLRKLNREQLKLQENLQISLDAEKEKSRELNQQAENTAIQLQQLEEAVSLQKEEVTSATARAEQAQVESENLLREKKVLEKRLEEEKELMARSGEEKSREMAKLLAEKDNQLSSNSKEKEELTKIISQAKKEKQNLQENFEELEKNCKKLKNDISCMDDKYKTAETEIVEKNKKIEEMNAQHLQEYAGLEKIVQRLKMENKDRESMNDSLCSQVSKLKNGEMEKDSVINSLRTEIDFHKQKNSSLSKLIEENFSSNKSSEDNKEVQQLQGTVETLEGINRKLKTERDNLQKEVLALEESRLTELLKSDNELKILRSSTQTEINRLKQENANLKEELNESDDSGDARLLFAAKQGHLKRISELELENFELSQKLKSVDVEELNREVEEIKTSLNGVVKTFTTDFMQLIEEKDKFYAEFIEENEGVKYLEMKNQLENKTEELNAVMKEFSVREKEIQHVKEIYAGKTKEYDSALALLSKKYEELFKQLLEQGKFHQGKSPALVDPQRIVVAREKDKESNVDVFKLKIKQLERENVDLSQTIQLMTQCVGMFKKKKRGSSNMSSTMEE
ncbi:myosin [Nucleospora cyclopteri]